MALTTIFRMVLFASLLVTCSCIAGTNELEGLAQGGDGQLISYLLLKIVSGLEADIHELKENLELKAQVEDMQELKEKVADDGKLVEELKAEIMELKSKNRDQPKAVFAQMQLLGTRTYKARDRFYFTTTIANVGNAYDTLHGYFEAPYDGTYMFAVTMCTSRSSHVDFVIVQDGNIIDKVVAGDADWNTCTSTTVVTQMQSGSRVWVEITRVYGGEVNSNYGIPSFTGVLLNNYKSP